MWEAISRLVTRGRGRTLAIAGWIIVPVTLFVVAPSLTDVSSTRQQDFLPVGVESTRAISVRHEHFPSKGVPGMLVYNRPSGLSENDLILIENQVSWLLSREQTGHIGDVISVFNNPGLTQYLASDNGTTMMVTFTILYDPTNTSIELIQEEIRLIRSKLVIEAVNGLGIWFTGPAGVLEDAVSVFQSVDKRITIFTVALVLVILLAIYRAPLLAVIPLLSAGLAYLGASGIVAILADRAGLVVNAQATTIMVVLIFGAGTDYMLFISARWKEYMRDGDNAPDAISKTMAKIGPAIFSSACTTIFAMLALGLATLRSLQVLGPVLALGMVFAIIAGLTFVPAVLSLLGRRAYWPTKITTSGSSNNEEIPTTGIWFRIARMVGEKPMFTALACIIAFGGMALGTLTMKPSYDMLTSLPADTESVLGFEALRREFEPGAFSPITVFVVLDGLVMEDMEYIETVTGTLANLEGIIRVSGPTRPFGRMLPISPTEQAELIAGLPKAVRDNLDEYGVNAIPDLIEQQTLSQEELPLASGYLATLRFISATGTVAQLDVITEEKPGSMESLEKIGTIRRTIDEFEQRVNTEILVGGETAIQYDTMLANNRDIQVIAPIALVLIFVVLVILIRAIVAPLYLVASVVLSFLGSLGVSVVIFQNLLGHEGIGSGVPIFMFLFLVALGIDYNIYLIARIREESMRRPIKEGTIIAVSSTGGVITSAGVILAGTFAAMSTLPLRDLFQLGFVVSLGVILDTIFVRGFMVPSIAMLLGRWNWWPFMNARDENHQYVPGND